MKVKAVKKRSKLRIKVTPQSGSRVKVAVDRRKTNKKWRTIKKVKVSSERQKKTVNFKRGRYRVRALANQDFAVSSWGYAKLKR
ncbi:MAG: hypothetical protein K0U64_02795 [Actinomycetia bacterium]|nr:hypothetical protein [Actinomycetes bacterium]